MFKYFQTSTLILIWCVVLSIGWAFVTYQYAVFRKSYLKKRPQVGNFAVVPALVISPVFLVVFFKTFHLNLLFPLHFFATFFELFQAAFFPGLILILASGLFGNLFQTIRSEYRFWLSKPFATVTTAMGQKPELKIRRLVLMKSLASCWSQCLPWLFGELIIVEAVFNAPGLGLDAWHMAKTRNIAGLGEVLIWLSALYLIFLVLSNRISKWVGERLESYG